MVVREIPDGLEASLPGSSKALNCMMSRHETVSDGRHTVLSNDVIMIVQASVRRMPGRYEEVMSAAMNKPAFETCDN
jgi:hypothetical protein